MTTCPIDDGMAMPPVGTRGQKPNAMQEAAVEKAARARIAGEYATDYAAAKALLSNYCGDKSTKNTQNDFRKRIKERREKLTNKS